MRFRKDLFWFTLFGACILAAGPASSAAKRVVSAIFAESTWQKARESDRPAPKPGEPAVWLSIPSISMGLPALQDVTDENLQKFPSVVAWPGRAPNDPGLTVILGHRDTHFRPLERLKKNAMITVEHRDGSRKQYRIIAIDILDPTAAQKKIRERMDRDELVLMTCHPFRYVGSAPNRILFWASPMN